jgi:protein-S-isoprenylcysteine O-methyltransferase Ste14
MNIFKNKNGMNIIGQGGKIILFMLPALIAAIILHLNYPQFVSIPYSSIILETLGELLLIFGVILWGTAIVQLLLLFPKGKLIKTGAYGIVRNPIYSSVTFFILPAISILYLTWVYFVVAIFLYIGVVIFIGKEEKALTDTFGEEYKEYMKKVNRMIPFLK